MYPSGPLNRLALRKVRLQTRVARRREEAAAAGRRLIAPLEKIDVWRARLRRIGPYLPVGLTLFGLWRRRSLAPLLRWAPVAMQGLRFFRNFRDPA